MDGAVSTPYRSSDTEAVLRGEIARLRGLLGQQGRTRSRRRWRIAWRASAILALTAFSLSWVILHQSQHRSWAVLFALGIVFCVVNVLPQRAGT